jgi:hypothetical protein
VPYSADPSYCSILPVMRKMHRARFECLRYGMNADKYRSIDIGSNGLEVCESPRARTVDPSMPVPITAAGSLRGGLKAACDHSELPILLLLHSIETGYRK